MAVDTPARVRPPSPATRVRALPVLTAHAVRAFTHNPPAAFFTLAFPLAFLIIVASIVGDQTTDAGVPVAQFLVPPFAVFGVAQASFTLLATDTAVLRENGVLLRQRAAPVPARTVLAARTAASVIISGAAVALLVAVGVLAYDVEVVWRKVPAMLVTLLLGIACCASLGLALAALVRTARAAQALAQGLLIPLAFISEVFIVGADLPRPLSAIGSALPLKHFALAMAETFDPAGGYGFRPGHLLVLTAWTVAGAFTAQRWFGWQPRGEARPRSEPEVAPHTRLSAPVTYPRRSPARLLPGQIRYALTGLRRDPLAVFFAVVFPALLLVLFPSVFGDARVHGLSMAQYLFAGMLAYTAAVSGYVDLPEAVVAARSSGVLQRLRGTPLPLRLYLAGRVSGALLTTLLAAAVLAAAGIGFLGVRVPPAHLPAILVTIVLGSFCFAALGLALVALLRSARTLVAITLGTLLPLCFASEIFVAGDRPLPDALTTLAGVFPLRHLLQALLAATEPDGGGAGFAGAHLAVVAAWTLAGLLIIRGRGLGERGRS
ncbi:ABC transporter permease [Paractinoplanes atraurantiacus]|uniref:Transport permease protein n=1 Tax=Paractinoplanes atraurantiacus TaxID=1036182 RepID=A0A285JIQ9_9ACTN|nr:ABC transporter permease [Actinoplanes atraurantiacus]SNY59266.1 ABC-type multidrug transport system, permease component [Actinoplanes atraurantiacus]